MLDHNNNNQKNDNNSNNIDFRMLELIEEPFTTICLCQTIIDKCFEFKYL